MARWPAFETWSAISCTKGGGPRQQKRHLVSSHQLYPSGESPSPCPYGLPVSRTRGLFRKGDIMKLARLVLYVCLVALLGVVPVMAHEEAGPSEKLGQVHFPISCSAAAQQQFDRAVALLHSFWYEEAVKAFAEVTQTDPHCAMGYWGISMSLWYPLWYPP